MRQRARPNRRATRRRGATVVEFALVAPLFLLFVFALFQFGRYIMVQQALTNAAREGSRTAALATTPKEDTTRAQSAVNRCLESIITGSPVVPEVSFGTALGTGEDTVTVKVGVNASDVTWLPAFSEDGMFGSLMGVGRLEASSTHVREQQGD